MAFDWFRSKIDMNNVIHILDMGETAEPRYFNITDTNKLGNCLDKNIEDIPNYIMYNNDSLYGCKSGVLVNEKLKSLGSNVVVQFQFTDKRNINFIIYTDFITPAFLNRNNSLTISYTTSPDKECYETNRVIVKRLTNKITIQELYDHVKKI